MGKAKGTTKSGGQKNALDKFYTKTAIAKKYIDLSNIKGFNVIIEPSAGSGAFSSQIKNCIAMDLEPEGKGIIQQDWFEYVHVKGKKEKTLVIGNPPFGQQNSLAIGFINHAAKFADRVAFILPISFKKESIQNRIDPLLHLVFEEDLPPNSFTLEGVDYNVKCVFQIWDKKDTARKINKAENINSNSLFSYVKKNDNPDACIQRVGGNAGKAFKDWSSRSEQSNYFIKFNNYKDLKNIDKVIAKLNAISYPSRDHAVGPRSLSKSEVNSQVNLTFTNK